MMVKESAIQCDEALFNLIAGVFELALRDARCKDEKLRRDAIEWLRIVAPEWAMRLDLPMPERETALP